MPTAVECQDAYTKHLSTANRNSPRLADTPVAIR
jgi:hypothetical protein